MITPYWMIKDGELVQATLEEWADWYEDFENRIVAKDTVGETEILTVCFGMEDYPRFSEDEPPIVLGTALINGKSINEVKQHKSIGEAKRFHSQIVELLQSTVNRMKGKGEVK